MAAQNAAACCYVTREDWSEYCRIAEDIKDDADYDKWHSKIKDLEAGLAAQEIKLVKIDTKPADLLAWCQSKGLKVNASSRSQYAANRMMDMSEGR